MSDNHSGVPTGGDTAPVELNVGASDDQGSVETTARSIYDELLELLVESKGQIANVAALVREGVTDRTEMVERGAAANTGAVGNLLLNIRAICEGVLPNAPSNASLALSAARSFRRQKGGMLSPQAAEHLDVVVNQLEAFATDRDAQDKEEEEVKERGEELERELEASGGIYAYTLPPYWRVRTLEGTNRALIKVGKSKRDAHVRIREQYTSSMVPEPPLVLRVYTVGTHQDLGLIEKTFHRLLQSADHGRPSGSAGGREWFETSVEFLDTIAEVLGLDLKGESDLA